MCVQKEPCHVHFGFPKPGKVPSSINACPVGDTGTATPETSGYDILEGFFLNTEFSHSFANVLVYTKGTPPV